MTTLQLPVRVAGRDRSCSQKSCSSMTTQRPHPRAAGRDRPTNTSRQGGYAILILKISECRILCHLSIFIGSIEFRFM